MATVGILTEKSSAAKNFAAALGGMRGRYQGVDYEITAASGHLYEFVNPSDMVPVALAERYGSAWDLANLPWDETVFSWKRAPKKGATSKINDIQRTLAMCEEIVIGSDIDPSGEGGLLAWEIIDALDLHDKKISRMEFVDESPASLQKAFVARRSVTSMADEGEYRKADYRSKFDLLSMQWTRAATVVLGDTGRNALLRNGRLKSAMVRLVGDGMEAHNAYKKVPFYDNRFRDDHGVMYVSEDEPQFPNKADVPGGYGPATVKLDSETTKKTAPPKLLDLAGLSALLSKKGMKADAVLKTYQRMYENQVVSYPRTEDRTVTPEQYKELLPKIDQIAGVVGIDPAVLTHRAPRSTHVKPKGAHGANRPGPNVPASLDAVEGTYGAIGREIYTVLAKNYLTMLGEDYTYTHQKAHLVEYPAFTGTANIPISQGWKGIFVVDDDEGLVDDEATARGVGTTAEPYIHEGFPPRPPHPSMTWLMKQLDKHDVGTGATRTSTYAEVTGGKNALLKETKSKLTMSEVGELNYRLLPGTFIGDLSLTETVYKNMDAIEAGTLDTATALEPVKDWVMKDVEVMKANAKLIPQELGASLSRGASNREYYQGQWNGKPVKFNRKFTSHRFTDEECRALCNGETITVPGTTKDGKSFKATGKLADISTTIDGKKVNYVGFKLDPMAVDETVYAVGRWVKEDKDVKFKRTWSNHTFTETEIADLLAGKKISFDTTTKAGKPYTATGDLQRQTFSSGGKNYEYVGFKLAPREFDASTHIKGKWKGKEITLSRTWSTHTFTDQELKDLFAGKVISFETVSNKTNKPYTAKGSLGEDTYQGKTSVKFIPDFSKKR